MYRKGEYLKSGWFGIYRGNEYELIGDMEGNDFIRTTDKNIIDKSYKKGVGVDVDIYTKQIDYSELEYAYELNVYALVDGEKIGVEKETDDEYLVFTGNSHKDIIDKYGLIEVERSVFEGWISKEFVELLEERRELQYNPETKALEFKD